MQAVLDEEADTKAPDGSDSVSRRGRQQIRIAINVEELVQTERNIYTKTKIGEEISEKAVGNRMIE
jgi:hypothetical protein